jgi:hypothetical protein
LKSKVTSKLINTNLEISFIFKYLNNPQEYTNTWKFDLKKKNEMSLWLASEAQEYKNNIKRNCYMHPITSFSENDSIKMRINIYSKIGIIDPNSIKFNEIFMINCPELCFSKYEKSIIKSNKKFDKSRICEFENTIHLWKNEKSLSNKNNIEEFKFYFDECFKIFEVSYDFAKFYVYKVKMEAKKIGKFFFINLIKIFFYIFFNFYFILNLIFFLFFFIYLPYFYICFVFFLSLIYVCFIFILYFI